MTQLGTRDYEAVLAFLEEAHAVDGPAPFTPELLNRLAQLADCEWATFFEVDFARRIFMEYIPCAAEGWDGRVPEADETYWTSRRTVQLLRHKALNGLGPVVLADIFTARERADPDFNVNFRDGGFTDQAHLNLDPTRNWGVELVLYRRGDVGERARLMLKLLRPHLAATYRAARTRRRLAHTSSGLDPQSTAQLTPREREVLDLVAEGLTNAEIARELWVAPGTVRTHLEHVFAKLGVHTRTAAIARLRQPSH